MKTKNKLIRSLLFLAVSFSLPLLVNSQTFSEKREESKSFKIKSGTLIQISNKYGNVNVMPWAKDSVRIEVSLSAQSKQASKVQKILSSIDCEMISTAGFVSARTVFHDNSATFWKDVVSYAGKVVNTSNNLQIHYTVYMPAENPVKIENKFGNIYMDSHRGNTDITLSNGDMQARDFSGNLKLSLEFGSATIQDADRAQLNINYSDLSLQNVNTLNLNSRSSTFDIDHVTSADITSVRDKLNIRSCSVLGGDASFSKIKVNALETTCTLNTKYGELKLNSIDRNFHNIYVKSEYTDILFGFNPASAYSADLIYDSKTILNIYPQINSQLKKETLNVKYGTLKASGEIGKSGTAQVTVSMKSGSLSLLNK